MGTACYVKGIKEINDRIVSEYKIGQSGISEDGRFGLEHVRCLGACSLAPVMVVNNDTHGVIKADMINDILAEYR
jgi:NADH-quinone oxidoreductase subunit E